jgi:hypothetical protein
MAKSLKKLTKRVVDALQADSSGRDVIHFDAEVARFGVRVKPSGVKSYVLQYRNKFGQPRRYTIGRVGDLTPTEARERALILRNHPVRASFAAKSPPALILLRKDAPTGRR